MVKTLSLFMILFCSCCDCRRIQWSIKLIGDEIIKPRSGKYPEIIGKMHGSVFLACEIEFINRKHYVLLPKIKFHWYRNKKEIKLPPPYYLSWKKGSVLMVRPLIPGRTNGFYQCEASYGGVVKKRGVNIVIKNDNDLPVGFPRISTHPGHVRTLRNKVDFHCIIMGKPPLKIIWFHDRVPLPSSPNFVVSPTLEVGKTFSSNLMIKNVTSSTKGFFQCVAMNAFGQSVSKQGNILFSDKQKRMKRTLSQYNLGHHNSLSRTDKCKISESEIPAGSPRNVSAKCICESTTDECFYEIIWAPPEPGGSKITHYHVTFYKYGLPIPNCFIVPNNVTSFIFNKEKGFDDDNVRYTVSVTAEPIMRESRLHSVKTVFADYCPKELSIVDQLPNDVIEEGGHFVFDCNYEGTPGPDSITWAFSPDLKACKDPKTIANNTENMNISDDKKHLKVSIATKEQEGCYVCIVENTFFSDSQHGYLRVREKHKTSKRILGPILGGVTGGILIVLIIIMLFKCLPKKPIPALPEKTVYISHCAESESSKMKLLKFASVLKMCNINVCIDLLSEVSINNAGGMSHWIPECMHNASKVMVMVSKDYLETLYSNDLCCNDNVCGSERTENFCKIRAEYNIINKMIYHERTTKLILVCDDVAHTEFPDMFKGRSYCTFPKDLNDYTNNNDFIRILEVLTEHEQLGWFRLH